MRFLSLLIITLLRPTPEQMAAAQRWCASKEEAGSREDAETIEYCRAMGIRPEVWWEAKRRVIAREVEAMRAERKRKAWTAKL